MVNLLLRGGSRGSFVEEKGTQREVTLDDVYTQLEGHPKQVLATVYAIITQGPDQFIPSDQLGNYLIKILMHATLKTWRPSIETTNETLLHELSASAAMAAAGGKPRYRFLDVPEVAVSPQPKELFRVEPTRVYSSYLTTAQATDPADLKSRANTALDYLYEVGYLLPLDPKESQLRREQVGAAVRNINLILEAAACYPMAQIEPQVTIAPLFPGGVPTAVAFAVENFQNALELTDALDFDRVGRLMAVTGVASENVLLSDLEITDLSEVVLNIDERLQAFGDELKQVADRLKTDLPTDWWLEGARLKSAAPLRGEDLRGATAKVAEHLVVPGLAPPPNIYGEILDNQMPIVLALSDLHIGQGESVDNADEIYQQLDHAFIQALNNWSAKVTQYRHEKGQQPAYLVLHGDILDFWSADMTPDPNTLGGWRVSAAIDPTSGDAHILPQQATDRMKRILAAHKPFFGRITSWVNESNFNFVIYVCGNHDDYLNRFALGDKLAKKLHPTRGAFAAKSAYFPQLRAVYEHGHRGDTYNAYNPSGTHLQTLGGSLGELIVMMMVNPTERGGPNFINQLGSIPGTNVFQHHGLNLDQMSDLQKTYDHFFSSRQVQPEVYEAFMGSIDNLDNGGMEDVVADCAGRELVRANPTGADQANVADLDVDIESLKGVWLSSDFQTFLKRWIARPLSHAIPPTVQSWLINRAFAANHAKRLGFKSADGIERQQDDESSHRRSYTPARFDGAEDIRSPGPCSACQYRNRSGCLAGEGY